jgi:hypothetical protein
MSDQRPYQKITIIIEGPDSREVAEFPVTRDHRTEVEWREPTLSEGGRYRMPDMRLVTFSFQPLRDESGSYGTFRETP